MITQYVFMTEEVSMERFLKIALDKILPIDQEIHHLIIPHEGKQDLEKSIPRKLRAWKNNNDIRYQFIIVRDKDSGNCAEIKTRISSLCRKAGRDDTFIIIVIHELESWFLGDLNAVEKAYKINGIAKKQKQRLYRNPDAIANASEQLAHICNDTTKISRAENITLKMDFDNNLSQSFNYFIRKM